MTETCRNCRFGHLIPYEGVDNNYCRLNPPEFLPPGNSQLKPVNPEGWCGQWQQVPAPVSDPDTVRSKKLSVPPRRKSGIASII